MAVLNIVPGQSGYMNLTIDQRDTIQHVERFGASLSLVGVFFIFITYGLFQKVRTVPNTFIFFASIANVGASVACLIGYAGILAGDDSGLCRVQAFLLEMFMQSDPWWSFAMAINVYMVFFMAYNPNNFHKHLWAYCIVCFGLPALPAFICLFLTPKGQRIYGNATLWCWIADSYNQLRIFIYYLPIWLCIALSAVIYVAVGYHVFHQRNQLRNLTLSNQAKDHNISSGTDLRGSAEKPQQITSYGTVTTEVQVTAECSDSQTPPLTPTASIAPVLGEGGPHHIPPSAATTAQIHPWATGPTSVLGDIDIEHYSPTGTSLHCPPALAMNMSPFTTNISSVSSTPVPDSSDDNNSRNRYTLRNSSWFAKFVSKLRNLDPIKLAYLRTSFVFAVSVLVTWTPSSVNRVYSLMYPERTSYGLNLASAVVLPLQGLWNAVIFTATTWTILREEYFKLKRRWWPGRGSQRLGENNQTGQNSGFRDRNGSGQGPNGEMLSPPPLSGTRMGTVRVIRGGSL
ncbi:putative G-protein coupled receptor [Podospora australis]|uniref:G-protein coupled receptor n=1 Tax=Podospora australis TaxID=1536484 RepID=A0AAN7AEE9_9PEZI|nr:putative G-protein coupled receptor [Podospora australis]